MINQNSIKLVDLAEIIPGFAFKSDDFGSEGELVIKIKDISPPFIDINNAERVNLKNYNEGKLSKYIISKGDFVVAMTGATIGKVGKHTSNEKCYINQRVAKIIPRKNVSKEFIYYSIQRNSFIAFILDRLDSSSAQGNISAEGIGNFPLPNYTETTQIKIASVLSSLDSKIELNNRINAELEAMAKTIYDYWFVQFDFPDKNGKPYKSSGGKMVWNEELKREVPEGWQVKSLFEVCQVQYGFPFSTNYFNEEQVGVPVIRIRDILENTISNYSTESEIDEKYLIKEGDLLIGMDGNFHINYWSVEGCYLNQRVVKLTETNLPNIYLKYQVEPYIKLREQSVSRTTVGHLSDKDLKAIRVLVPSKETLSPIKKLYTNGLGKIIHNKKENQQLASLRDWLLPMLMNGQVKVN